MPQWGVGAAGFVAKPYASILADIQSAQLATMNPAIDLSPSGPLGQQNGIMALTFAQLWQLAQTVYNGFNRQAAEGAALDNLGALTGSPRDGGTYTQVLVTLTFTGAAIGQTFIPGSLIANVSGSPSFTFQNFAAVVGASSVTGVVMQSLAIGQTATVNPATLTVITNPVTGWTSITNPLAQSQLGANEEPDPDYASTQSQDLFDLGTCTLPATIAALYALAAAQTPPIAITVSGFENTTRANTTTDGITLIPNSYAIIAYDPTGWVSGAGEQAIGNAIWDNKPAGNAPIGSTSVVVQDTYLGPQTVYYTVPAPEPIYLNITVVIRTGFVFGSVAAGTGVCGAIVDALVEAAVAPTPAGGTPPNGQLQPGSDVIGAQLEAVVMGVAGVYDVHVLQFGTSYLSANTSPVLIGVAHIATIASGNDGSSHPYFTITQDTTP